MSELAVSDAWFVLICPDWYLLALKKKAHPNRHFLKKQNLSNKNAWQRSAERNLVVVLICIILMDLRFFHTFINFPKTIINHPITSCYIDMLQIQNLQPSPPVLLFASQVTTWEPFWLIGYHLSLQLGTTSTSRKVFKRTYHITSYVRSPKISFQKKKAKKTLFDKLHDSSILPPKKTVEN